MKHNWSARQTALHLAIRSLTHTAHCRKAATTTTTTTKIIEEKDSWSDYHRPAHAYYYEHIIAREEMLRRDVGNTTDVAEPVTSK